MVKLNIPKSVNDSFHKLVEEEIIESYDCQVCLTNHNASLEKRVVEAGRYLIFQLKRYKENGESWVKDLSLVDCVSKELSLSVSVDDEVQCRKSYNLVASICHSGTRAAGHYTAHVLNREDGQWLLCNDKAVLSIKSSDVNNKYSYLLFYELSS